jgi:hypothetical protein
MKSGKPRGKRIEVRGEREEWGTRKNGELKMKSEKLRMENEK